MHGVDPKRRTAAADEDGADHIGLDTPRSGVATPQPDLQDKRLPGIMSYFGQVRKDPLQTHTCSSVSRRPEKPVPLDQEQDDFSPSALSSGLQSQPLAGCSSSCRAGSQAPRSHGSLDLEHSTVQIEQRASHPYPTPPISHPSSSSSSSRDISGLCANSTAAESAAAGLMTSNPPPSHPKTCGARFFTTTHYQMTDDAKSCEAESAQSSPSLAPRDIPPTSTPSSPPTSLSTSQKSNTISAPGKWFSFDGLKELTRAVTFKSGPPTPTRALSAARTSQSDVKATSTRSSNDRADTSVVSTSRSSSSGAQAPAQRGKLLIKIAEARGLRKSRDPYVVVVFQRSELISGGPHPAEEEEALSTPPAGMGGIPIQRQASDSGRPPMSIPMRSRQSSNTSSSDHNTFRTRSGRMSFTNPLWDAEAEL